MSHAAWPKAPAWNTDAWQGNVRAVFSHNMTCSGVTIGVVVAWERGDDGVNPKVKGTCTIRFSTFSSKSIRHPEIRLWHFGSTITTPFNECHQAVT